MLIEILRRLFALLFSDTELRARFEADPEAVLTEAGLEDCGVDELADALPLAVAELPPAQATYIMERCGPSESWSGQTATEVLSRVAEESPATPSWLDSPSAPDEAVVADEALEVGEVPPTVDADTPPTDEPPTPEADTPTADEPTASATPPAGPLVEMPTEEILEADLTPSETDDDSTSLGFDQDTSSATPIPPGMALVAGVLVPIGPVHDSGFGAGASSAPPGTAAPGGVVSAGGVVVRHPSAPTTSPSIPANLGVIESGSPTVPDSGGDDVFGVDTPGQVAEFDDTTNDNDIGDINEGTSATSGS